jgi:type I restriction enzyme M protein
MPANHSDLEKRLWDAADELRANSKLKSSEYSIPVLGLIFLRYAGHKFAEAEKRMPQKASGRRKIGKTDYQAQGVLYLPDNARFGYLLNLPEGTNIGKAINEAMKAIEAENEDLKDVLPKTYNGLEKSLLVSLLKNFAAIPMTIEGDAFGKIYEYFLGKFAMAEGQKGGEFFTPISIVKLIVDIIEPFHGQILDPASGSGGMFVQSAAFVEHHKKSVNEISAYGQEKVAETIRLCKMNLAVHGLSGDIRQAVTYYEDVHKSVGKFDFVMANPPFNVDKVDKERINVKAHGAFVVQSRVARFACKSAACLRHCDFHSVLRCSLRRTGGRFSTVRRMTTGLGGRPRKNRLRALVLAWPNTYYPEVTGLFRVYSDRRRKQYGS